MLENKIDELIAALRENTAARLAEVGGAATGGAKAGAKPGAKPGAKADKPKYTAEKVKTKVLEVKEKHGMERAKEIIAETGSDDLADLLKNPDRYNAAYELAEAAANEGAVSDDDDGL